MRLLIVTQNFWPENFRINDLASEFVARGHDVTVLTGLPNYPDGQVFSEFRREPRRFDEFKGARILRVPIIARGRRRLRLPLNYASYAISASVIGSWRLRRRQFDAIFVFEPSPVTVGVPAVVLRRLKRAPVAFWVLDLWPETLRAVGVVHSPAILRMVGWLVSFIYDRCDLILAQSRGFVPSIARYRSTNAPIRYFPSWAESLFGNESASPAAEIPPRPGSFDVLFAGNIGDAQDFPAILGAAELLKGFDRIRWLVVGDGSKAQWVRDEVRRRGLQDRVVLLGRYPVERMPDFYAGADVLLVALKNDPIFSMTIPGKLQSYLAAGVPIVAMLDGEGADVVKRAGAGLSCPAGDSAGLADAVRRMAAMSSEQISAMGRRGRAFSATEYSRPMLMDRLERWLTALVNGARGNDERLRGSDD